jgi:hypothetical protein
LVIILAYIRLAEVRPPPITMAHAAPTSAPTACVRQGLAPACVCEVRR